MSWVDRLKAPGFAQQQEKSSFPEGLWTKCPQCSEILFNEDVARNLWVCVKCQYHFRIRARDRLKLILEADSFHEIDAGITPVDVLEFRDQKRYRDRIKALDKEGNETESYIYGDGKIQDLDIAVGSFVFEYMGGSMGSVAGEKLTRTFELAADKKVPCLVIMASGGARMQEGIFSLMQMAKSTTALGRLRRKAKMPYIAFLTDPTTGGVAASCAMLGDVIFAEPNALIGFAGPRVIEQTIKEKLPEGFQRSEFLLEHGMVDRIVHRHEAKELLYRTFSMLSSRRLRS